MIDEAFRKIQVNEITSDDLNKKLGVMRTTLAQVKKG
jgi:hypothetical protein